MPRLVRPTGLSRRRSSGWNIEDAAYPSNMNPEELDTDTVLAGCCSGVRKGDSSTKRSGVGVFKGMLKRRRRQRTTVSTGSSGDRCILGLNVDFGDEYSCISNLDLTDEKSSVRTVQGSGAIVALSGVWGHDETSGMVSIDHAPCRPERQALVGSSHDQESELSRMMPVRLVACIRALALVFLSLLMLYIKQSQMFWN